MSDHSDLLERFAQLQTDTFGHRAFSRGSACADKTPYWTNSLGPAEFVSDGDVQTVERRTVISRLIVGHWSQDYDGEVENDLYALVSQWHAAISDTNGNQLIGTTNTTAPTYLHALGVWLEGDGGLDYFLVPGVPHVQIGIEFSHLAHLFEAVNY